MLFSVPTLAQVHSNYAFDILCLRNDSIELLDQYVNYLGRELADYSSESSTKNLDGGEDCLNQIINTNNNLDVFVNAFSGNVEPNNLIVIFFSKVFDLFVRPSSIVLLFSILATGIVLNYLKKLKKDPNKARKGFSQGTRERILRKQNRRCAYCRKNLTVIDYHHTNGNRSDNRENNCQALCPNCHAIKTRKNLIKN